MTRRDRFKIEFSPLPIPTEPPDAPGGHYFYLSRQWLAFARGMLAYLGMRRFWQDAPEQYDQILQWVYKLLDEIDLPDGETIEIPIYIPMEGENDYDNADCEDNCMACNCGNVANVRYCEDTGWEYRGSDGLWHPVPDSAIGTPPDEQDPSDVEPPPVVSSNACSKAWALWETLFIYMEALEEQIPSFDFSPIPIDIEFREATAWWVSNMMIHKANLPIQKVNAIYGLSAWYIPADAHAKIDYLQEFKDEIGATFICAMQDVLSKETRLSDAELAAARDYTWDSGDTDLNGMLQATLKRVISTDYLKERAAIYVRGGGYECNCVGSAPTPPAEIPAGYGQLKLELVRAFGVDANPASAGDPTDLRALDPNGTITQLGYETAVSDGAFHQGLGMLVSVPAGFKIDHVWYTMVWMGEGEEIGSGRQLAEGFYGSTGDTDDFTTLAENAGMDASFIADPVTTDGPLSANRYIYISYETIGNEEGDLSAVRISELFFDVKKDGGGVTLIKIAPGTIFPL